MRFFPHRYCFRGALLEIMQCNYLVCIPRAVSLAYKTGQVAFLVVKKISTMTERTNEESFSEVYADALSDCPSDCESNSGNLENDTVSEDSESDIRPPKSQKRNIIVSDSDDELEEEWNEHDITPNLPNYLNIPGATIARR